MSTPPADPPRRLVVELTRHNAETLDRLMKEEDVNKTTVVNRAVTLYAAVSDAQRAGGTLLIRDVHGELTRVLLLSVPVAPIT